MAAVNRIAKLVFGGTLFTEETWSCSFHVVPLTVFTYSEADLRGAVTNWMTRASSHVNRDATLDWLKYNEVVPATGHYIDGAAANTLYFEPKIHSGFTVNAPGQIALVASLGTDVQRGRTSRGRIYIPMGLAPGDVDATGHIAGALAQAVATSTAQLVTDINGAVSGSVVVFSSIGQIYSEVDRVMVGDVVDTQRRRRRSLAETYSTVGIS